MPLESGPVIIIHAGWVGFAQVTVLEEDLSGRAHKSPTKAELCFRLKKLRREEPQWP